MAGVLFSNRTLGRLIAWLAEHALADMGRLITAWLNAAWLNTGWLNTGCKNGA